MNWDALGILTSIACAIHCAFLPLVLTTLPLFGINIIDNVAFEYFMIFLAFIIGAVALWHGYRKHHRSRKPLILFTAGILLLFVKQEWHEYQYIILPFAVIFIVAAHIMNYRTCRVQAHTHSSQCSH